MYLQNKTIDIDQDISPLERYRKSFIFECSDLNPRYYSPADFYNKRNVPESLNKILAKISSSRSDAQISDIRTEDIVVGEYSPNTTIVALIQRVLEIELIESQEERGFLKIPDNYIQMDPVEIAKTISEDVNEIILRTGRTIKLGGTFSPDISNEDYSNFSIKFQNWFLQKFSLVPEDVSYFLEKLHNDIYAYVLGGGDFKADWGRVVINPESRKLFLEVNEE